MISYLLCFAFGMTLGAAAYAILIGQAIAERLSRIESAMMAVRDVIKWMSNICDEAEQELRNATEDEDWWRHGGEPPL